MHLVSVIVPCYNQASYLQDAVESVIFQSFNDWECIIVNDGSTDNTEQVANHLCERDNRIKYLKKENGGLSSARNAGIKTAIGNYIQLLDADDLLETDKLSSAIAEYEKLAGEQEIILYSSSRYFEHGSEETCILGRNDFISHIELKKTDTLPTQNTLLRKRNLCVISAPVYPIHVFRSVGFFDENLTALEDWDFHLRCSNKGLLFDHHYFERGNTLIRLHNDSMMRNDNHINNNWLVFSEKHQLISAEQNHLNAADPYRMIKDFLPPVLLKMSRKLRFKSKSQ
jgi:glycosyltransferase involved in cell wall biosynthesis